MSIYVTQLNEGSQAEYMSDVSYLVRIL